LRGDRVADERRSYLCTRNGAGACGRIARPVDARSRGQRCGLPVEPGSDCGVARVGAMDADYVLRAVDDAADGLSARVQRVRGLWTSARWRASVLARVGRWVGLRG